MFCLSKSTLSASRARAEARSGEATDTEYKTWLPLKDLFCNHKLEFDISLNDLKIAFDEMGLKQPRLAFASSA
ncbi:MAG TPA: hypothetical protein PLX55_00620 [bacterium]|nr:hypothetical protein [bacterium]